LSERLGIEVPIIQGSIGPWSSVRLAAAVSKAGGLGSIGTALRPAAVVAEDLRRMREVTGRPFAVNLTARPFDSDAWETTLAARPPVISYALGEPGELVEQAHEVGVLFVQQVHSVEQATRAAEQGVDVIIAQGAEAGGFGGRVSALPLVPQVVDAVAPIPVAVAGGIADGRGLAAALVLGAHGINIGTRFLASDEAEIPEAWKRRIASARSEDAVKAEFIPDLVPGSPGSFDVAPRVLRTEFVERWNADREGAMAHREELAAEVLEAVRTDRGHEYVPFSGQTAGLIHEILPVAEIVRRLVDDAEAALQRVA
jgi:nitronate monooxygenase/enoyl-[acyl-carrier protein] reductase II